MAQPLQHDLFRSEQDQLAALPDVVYRPDLIRNPDRWFSQLQSNLDWNPRYQSRLTASFGTRYQHGSRKRADAPLPDFLSPFQQRVTEQFGFVATSCLINYYPDGDHYISFHSDYDNDLADNTGVAILSLGAVREMVLRRIENHRERYYYPLQPGSGFYMSDASQKVWEHGIPRQRGRGPRISLSFRQTRRESGDHAVS